MGEGKEEVLRMGEFGVKGVEERKEFFNRKEGKDGERGFEIEDGMKNLERKIRD